MTYLDRVEMRFLRFLEVAYRVVQVFLVDVCVVGYALFDLADLRVGRQALIGREAERHGCYSRQVRDGVGLSYGGERIYGGELGSSLELLVPAVAVRPNGIEPTALATVSHGPSNTLSMTSLENGNLRKRRHMFCAATICKLSSAALCGVETCVVRGVVPLKSSCLFENSEKKGYKRSRTDGLGD